MDVGAKNILTQIITFCGVGGVNTVLSLLIILLLSEVLHVHYVLANIAGYAAGLVSGFIMHKHITFRAQASTRPVARQFISFLGVFATGYALQLGILMLLVEQMHIPNMPAQIAAWLAYVAISFAGNKYFTFEGTSHGKEHE